MKHAVIVAHPNPDSLNVALAGAYAGSVRKLGHHATIRDLYALGFDPCLKAAEIPGPGAPQFGDDVEQERALLADVDVFALVYPLWFNAPPAMLKGYIDRVFGMGFGFLQGPSGPEPQLGGRTLISITTSGAPDAWVRETGALGALTKLFDAHLAAVCGLRVADHLNIGGMVSGITAEAFDDVLGSVRDMVAKNFEDAVR